ncbi:hypothetical protein CON45_26025 [Priestia megaterium]|uniref:hypothetical protein n=1 Tax=Priestia megaterium TaxID=1404 RepID=UPI000BEB4D3A|nr:hypothetical protein [Priestia megaterium]PEA36177.1 hypothetical protein CON45_26025 [Priestia megaterium]
MELEDNPSNRYLEHVIEMLMEKYPSLSRGEATKHVVKSSFFETLKEDKEFVFHYHPTYWVDIVSSESRILIYT